MELEHQLQATFSADEHFFNYEGWAYISESAITNRLDSVVGIDNWAFTIKDIMQVTQTHYIVTARLTISINDTEIFREGIGEGTTSIAKPYNDKDPLKDPRYMSNVGENGAKGAATDALRRCARLFGIGRYLLDMPKTSYGKPEIKDHFGLDQWLENYNRSNAPKHWAQDKTEVMRFFNEVNQTYSVDHNQILSALGVERYSDITENYDLAIEIVLNHIAAFERNAISAELWDDTEIQALYNDKKHVENAIAKDGLMGLDLDAAKARLIERKQQV
jgi:hypothetical protein